MELKLIKSKKLLPVWIEPGTLGLWHVSTLHSHAFLTKLTCQVLSEGYLTLLGGLSLHLNHLIA